MSIQDYAEASKEYQVTQEPSFGVDPTPVQTQAELLHDPQEQTEQTTVEQFPESTITYAPNVPSRSETETTQITTKESVPGNQPVPEPAHVEPISQPKPNEANVTREEVARAAIQRAAGKTFDTTTKTKHQSVTVKEDPYQQTKEIATLDEMNANSLFIPTDHPSDILAVYSDQDYAKLVDTNEGRNYINTMARGQEMLPQQGAFLETVSKEGSDWQQAIESPAGPLRLSRPSFDENTGAKLKGNAAVIRINTLMGLNSLVTVPLWHSGFWVTIKTPSDVDLVNLEHQLAQAKVSLGRNLAGSMFSNETIYVAQEVFKLFESKVFSTTLKDSNDLASKISIQDLQTIAWALACAIYPKGYNYTRSVLTKNVDEAHMVTGVVDLNKISWTNYKSLSDYQIKHMTQRFGSTITDEQLQMYKESFNHDTIKRVVIEEIGTSSVSVLLKVPTLAEYFAKGDEWVQKCVLDADKALTFEASDKEREEYTLRLANARIMGKNAHFISSIIYANTTTGLEEVYSDQETIESFLESWSSSEDIFMKLDKAIAEFKDSTTMSLIATPTVGTETVEDKVFTHLVPMDAVLTFFILLGQKLSRLE